LLEDVLQRLMLTIETEMLILEDAHSGFEEIDRLVKERQPHFSEVFSGAGEIVVNATGGTTLLGYGAERLARGG
jgi:hypothetical protein